MPDPQILVLIWIPIVLALFIWDRIPVEIASMATLLYLVVTGVLETGEALTGFSNPATITVAAMFALSGAIAKTGILDEMGFWLGTLHSHKNPLGWFLLLMVVVLLSAFLNNTAVVAALIPIGLRASKLTGTNSARILIPLSYASILGGSCTLIGTSTNIIIHGVAVDQGLAGLGMFQMTPLGLVLALAGAGYLAFAGKHLLPVNKEEKSLEEKYQVDAYVFDIEITPRAESAGLPLYKSPLVYQFGMEIIEVIREGERYILPPKDMVLRSGDRVVVRTDLDNFAYLRSRMQRRGDAPVLIQGEGFQSSGTTLVEIMVQQGSELENTTLRKVEFKRKYRGIPLGIRQREEISHAHIEDVYLRAGDVLLIEMKTVRLEELASSSQSSLPFVLLTHPGKGRIQKKRLMLVGGILALVVGIAALGLLPIAATALAGVFFLVVTRNLSTRELYSSINWSVVVMLAGMLSLAHAMASTGLDKTLAATLLEVSQGLPLAVLLSLLYLSTMLLTEIMSNNATAALIAPVAIQMAHLLGLSPVPFLIVVVFAASSSFATPIGYQTNTMVYAAGGYRFKDFLKIGLPLNVLMWLGATLLIPLFY